MSCKIGQIEVSTLPARKNVASGGVRGRRGWCTAEVWEEEEEEEEEQQEEEEEEEMKEEDDIGSELEL